MTMRNAETGAIVWESDKWSVGFLRSGESRLNAEMGCACLLAGDGLVCVLLYRTDRMPDTLSLLHTCLLCVCMSECREKTFDEELRSQTAHNTEGDGKSVTLDKERIYIYNRSKRLDSFLAILVVVCVLPPCFSRHSCFYSPIEGRLS